MPRLRRRRAQFQAVRMWTRPADRTPSYGACGQALEKLTLPHRLPTLGALAPTSSPLRQQRFMGKAAPPAPAGSRIAPSSQAIRLRNTPTNTRGDPTRQSAKQHPIRRAYSLRIIVPMRVVRVLNQLVQHPVAVLGTDHFVQVPETLVDPEPPSVPNDGVLQHVPDLRTEVLSGNRPAPVAIPFGLIDLKGHTETFLQLTCQTGHRTGVLQFRRTQPSSRCPPSAAGAREAVDAISNPLVQRGLYSSERGVVVRHCAEVGRTRPEVRVASIGAPCLGEPIHPPLRTWAQRSMAIPIEPGSSRVGSGSRRSAALKRSQRLDQFGVYQIGIFIDYPETIP